MQLRRSRPNERAVSVVIGTVLLIAITTMVMALLASAVLGAGVFERSPQAELVYQEQEDGTVIIALANVRDLPAADTELRLKGEGSCGTWDGSGDLEKGDVTTIDGSDCPRSPDVGDVVQVIGSNTLLDSYELRGVSPDYDICEEAFEDGELEVNSGEVYECDLVDPDDGGRVDIDLQMRGGTLIGEVNLSDAGVVDLEGGTVDGSVNGEDFRLETDWMITGDLTVPDTASESSVNLKARTDVGGSVVTDGKSIELTDGVDVDGDVEISGSDEELDLKSGATIGGLVDVDESTVLLGPDAIVAGPVTAGELDLDERARVENDVDIAGPITLDSDAVIDGAVTAGDVTFDGDGTITGDVSGDEIQLEPEGTIHGDVAGNEISLKDRATIEGDVTDGDIVQCGSNAEINGNPCDEHENYTGS